MKKMTKTLVLVLALALALCVGVFAAEPTTDGVYNLTVSDGYTLTPNTTAASGEITISGGTVANFFPEAEKFTLSYAETNAANYHMVLALSDNSGVPTESNLVYIDQTSASEGKIDFTVYPSELVDGKTYYVYVVGTELAKTQVASFSYYEYEEPGVAEFNGTKYETLAAALTAAQSAGGGTVTLTSDVTENLIRVMNGVTLDLNGKKLTATVFVAVNGAQITDSSAGDTGRIACANPVFNATNSDFPILDTDGYLFTTVTKMNQTGSGDGSKYTYIFLPKFASGASVLGARGTDADVEFKLVLSWDGGEKILTYTPEMIKDVYANNRAFYAWITNYASYVEKNLTITVTVTSGRGITVAGTPWAIA
ncbi:MAG: hypothetical protein IKD11_00320 [Oscillospiraceae bacterium]|nr:hypothetical protein [Oscillospiraceae bacterium]